MEPHEGDGDGELSRGDDLAHHDESATEDSVLSVTDDDDSTWVEWFCSLKGNEYFSVVDEAFICDEFNLTGLSSQVPYYEYAYDVICDVESPNMEMLTDEQQEVVDTAAELLYGLIHARYILTGRGLSAMYEKYQDVDFGRCHRVYCQGQPVLPVGQSDFPRKATVNVYCPRCNDIYFPKSSRQGKIDGAYFGTTFPHLFFMAFPALMPAPPTQVYVPRVFGFKIYKGPVPGEDGEIDADGGGSGGGGASDALIRVASTAPVAPTPVVTIPDGVVKSDVTLSSSPVAKRKNV